MCGIFGFALTEDEEGSLTVAQRTILAAALGTLNDERGGQSWGLSRLSAEGVRTVKGIGEAQEVASEWGDSLVLAGHTRWATHGAVTVENAHPFHIDGIVGAHNGIIYSHDDANKVRKATGLPEYACDSQHIIAAIAAKKGADGLSGYGSVWYMRDGSLYIVKSTRGDLCCYGIRAYASKNAPVIGCVFSSSDRHANDALKMAGVHSRSFEYQLDEWEVVEVRSEGLYLAPKEPEVKLVSAVSTLPSWQDFGQYKGKTHFGKLASSFYDGGSGDEIIGTGGIVSGKGGVSGKGSTKSGSEADDTDNIVTIDGETYNLDEDADSEKFEDLDEARNLWGISHEEVESMIEDHGLEQTSEMLGVSEMLLIEMFGEDEITEPARSPTGD